MQGDGTPVCSTGPLMEPRPGRDPRTSDIGMCRIARSRPESDEDGSAGLFADHLATAQEQLRRFAGRAVAAFHQWRTHRQRVRRNVRESLAGRPCPAWRGGRWRCRRRRCGELRGGDAFGDWVGRSGAQRQKILRAVADLIQRRAAEITAVECVDTGQAIRFMSAAAIRGAENFRFFADHAPDAVNGRSMPDVDHLNYTMRRGVGPVGVITPWNTPFMLSTWKIAPALAAGCTVVHKPAEWSPCTAAMLAEIAFEAGLPPGVLNVVHGTGETAGKALTEHPAIRAIAFIGESATGR